MNRPVLPLRPLHTLLCAMLLSAAASAAHAETRATVELPALTQPPSGEHHVGKVIWADLVTPDVDGAKRFYGGLFGWTFRDVPGDPKYTLALLNGEPVAGIFQKALPAGQSQQPAWLTFLAVKDVAIAQQLAVQHGAKVLMKPHTYSQRGRQAILADPDGAVFAILAATGGDPPDYLAAPGEWIWSSLLVTNTKQESNFYKSLFGYDIYELGADDGERAGGQHFILSNDDYARVGLHAMPADSVRRHPHWLDFVRVADAAAVAKQAASLGGQVLVEPRIDRHGGQLAVLADPSGAPFGVMEWSDTDSEREPK